MYSISKIIEYAKEHGILSLFKAGVERFRFRHGSFILLSLSLEDPIPKIQSRRNITIRKAKLGDVKELHQSTIKHNCPQSKKQLSEWIAKGYPFFVAIAEDKIVGYACVSLEVVSRDAIFMKVINFKDDDAWGAHTFVLPTYRGSMISPALGIETMKCLKAAGYRRILCTTSANNIPARRAHKKIGYREIKKITFFRILSLEVINIKLLKEDIPDG